MYKRWSKSDLNTVQTRGKIKKIRSGGSYFFGFLGSALSIRRPDFKVGQIYTQISWFFITELTVTSFAVNGAPSKSAPMGPTPVNPETSDCHTEVVQTPNGTNH